MRAKQWHFALRLLGTRRATKPLEMRLHLNSTRTHVITAAAIYAAWALTQGYARSGSGVSGTSGTSATGTGQSASPAAVSANPGSPSATTNGLPTRATNGFTGGEGRWRTNGTGGVGTSITPGTNYFTPLGPEGYYTLGTNGGFLRGTNGFYRRGTRGAPDDFVPDGGELYERGPDGLYHRYDQDDSRGIYRNGVLYPSTNPAAPTNGVPFDQVR
jgi:hypothetical protein